METENYHLEITTIGQIASKALANSNKAFVQGRTSCGLYLRIASGWVVFLSFEKYLGPLTLNYRGNRSIFRNLHIGSQAYISGEYLDFPSIGQSIPWSSAQIWNPSLPTGQSLPLEQRRGNLHSFYQTPDLYPRSSPIANLLPNVLQNKDSLDYNSSDLISRLSALQSACQMDHIPDIADGLTRFLGLGSGLTPSGDDLVMGFVLGMNRWAEGLYPGLNTPLLNSRTTQHAKQLTNAISASLIACACLGQADERLIQVLDGIITGATDAGACVEFLSSWGNSSGFDALVGMALFTLGSFNQGRT